ncbi:hypothetical protein [Arthrobacter sp. zg-Y895]|uniref:hypothetical protein n=1 Tax=Arthrobacter sp. zg-Y895 TaxID=2886933 RepID=UPI001D13F93A|nr:hypothetical protein [Arthrobacter sp. zg-Y895]MCC3302186.1 hypothetical protein [Arthrobacter sp. zg-Y895]
MGLFSAAPIVEKREQWTTGQPPHAVMAALTGAFTSHGEDVSRDESRLVVHVGSYWTYRMLGTFFAAGRASVPLTLAFSISPSGSGTAIDVHGYDTYGFRMGNGTLFDVPVLFNYRLEEFLSYAAGVVGIRRPVSGAVPVPPFHL